MPKAVIYQDNRVTITAESVQTDAGSCRIADVQSTTVTGGTGIEEKIFLGIIVFFGVAIAIVGIVLQDNGELALGIGLALVTALIILQKCTLRLVTKSGKFTVVTDRDVRYIRRVRDQVEAAMGVEKQGP